MPLINCEINHILPWSAKCFIVVGTVANQVLTFAITDTKLLQNYYNNWNQALKE